MKPLVREGQAPTGAFSVSVHCQIWEPGSGGGGGRGEGEGGGRAGLLCICHSSVTQAPGIKASPLIAMDPSESLPVCNLDKLPCILFQRTSRAKQLWED